MSKVIFRAISGAFSSNYRDLTYRISGAANEC
jgi:hypothetical protein